MDLCVFGGYVLLATCSKIPIGQLLQRLHLKVDAADETLSPFKGRSPYKQEQKNQPATLCNPETACTLSRPRPPQIASIGTCWRDDLILRLCKLAGDNLHSD
eukprot:6306117-Amphidinium_carterae.1